MLHQDALHCAGCVQRATQSTPTVRPPSRTFGRLQRLAGAALLWFTFLGFGYLLTRLPLPLHDGPPRGHLAPPSP